MLQLFVLAAFFAMVTEATTPLQTFCALQGTNNAKYYGTSCYIIHQFSARYSVQKNSCQQILGYYGHLVFIKNSSVLSIVNALTQANVGINTIIYVGFEQADNTGARNANWGFGNINGSVTPSTYVPWATGGYPQSTKAYTRTVFLYNADGIGIRDTNGEITTTWSICEYEEGNYHNVTPLEQMCNATTLPHAFVNGKCYTVHTELKTYLAAKSSCNDFPGINGYLTQPNNSFDLGILDNLLLVPNGTVLGTIHIGVEHTNNGWYFSTSTGVSFVASYLPWAPSSPNGTTTSSSVYYQNRLYYNAPSNTLRAFICEYAIFISYYKQYKEMDTSNGVGGLFMSINTYTDVSLAKCLRLCRINSDCASMAYSTATSACQLLGVAANVTAANFTLTSDYEIFTFTNYADLN